ncbi:MAG: AhpC/TSA family protein [Dysgonamonadaceae bacterium]|jgi:peroxiredoxin|nr:AhpC/TSA family protein [Dysgonamonadaceae bacterium]
MAKRRNHLLNLIFALLCAFVFVSCKDTNSYTIHGNLKGLETPELYIATSQDSVFQIDTIRSKAGKFKYKSKSEVLQPAVIYMEKGNIWVTVWVKNGENIVLTGDINYPELVLAKGGGINDLLSDFKTTNNDLIEKKGDIRDKISANSKENDATSAEIASAQFSSQIKNIDQTLKIHVMDFVKSHPASVASLVLIQDFLLDIENAADIQPALSLITGEAMENELYAKLQAWVEKDRQTEVGSPAPDFNILSAKNDTIRLESFKNKYILLTFAASWSPFCETDYAKWVSIRKKFSEKDLGMLTISLDEHKADWEKLAKEKGFTWTQVIDNSGWSSSMVSLYNVSELPCNYLIDKDKKIIGSKMPIDSIQTILTKLEIRN